MRLRCSARTDVGLAREHNEDSYGIGEGDSVDRLGELLVLCDGMGGHAAGEVASQMGVDSILASYYSDETSERADALIKAFERANLQIYSRGKGSMGTTGVAALLHGDGLYIANVGDSRAYLIRDGTIRQISRDHSFVNDQIDAGLITAEQARVSQHRNVITRALGHQPEVSVDLFQDTLKAGDIVMLSSDGLHGLVLDEELAQIIRDTPPEEAVNQLIQLANERGGTDNITVVLAYVDEVDEDPHQVTEEYRASSEDQSTAGRSSGEGGGTEESSLRDALPPAAASEGARPDQMLAAPGMAAPGPGVPAPAERRLTLLGGLLAAMLLTVLLFVILYNLPATTTVDRLPVSAPSLAATAPARATTAPARLATAPARPASTTTATATAPPTTPAETR